ncbi:ketopantoate reductase family protein [Streptomyces sp. NPDC031705]|uniref:ketopantoate reductase family protein n=1 Tax=Streptomyces sp. NPDC031705 TaxID=3155729 RepID=UPI0033CF1F20
MRILVVGAGATGGYFGGRLAEAGRDVTFLVRPARAARLRSTGLVIRSPHGDLGLDPKLACADQLLGEYDLVLLAVKAYSLDRTLTDLAPAVGPRTVILPLLNGMRHIPLLRQKYGSSTVLGGVCRVTTLLDEDGSVLQLNSTQEIAYGTCGAAPAVAPARVRAVDAALRGAGFTVRHSEDITQEMWEKWVHVAAVGAVTCLMRGVIGDVVASPGGRDFAARTLAECAAVAAACGRPVRAESLKQSLAALTEPDSDTASSLYRDLLRGGPVEASHVLGDLIERGDRRAVGMPLLRLAYTHLNVYQRSLG